MTHLDHKSHCQLYLTIQTHTHTHIHTQTECIIAELKAHTKIVFIQIKLYWVASLILSLSYMLLNAKNVDSKTLKLIHKLASFCMILGMLENS